MAVPTMTANSPSAGFIAWSAFTIQYNGVAYSVAAGNSSSTYIAWLYLSGTPAIVASNNVPVMSAVTDGTTTDWSGAAPVLGPDDLLLFVNRNGVPINVQAAQMIDGDFIVSGTITSGNIATGTITANNIASGTITATQIATDTITANQIAANAIGTSELSSSSVIADKIAAGAITAEKLTIGSLGDNVIKNSGMEDASQANALLPANWSTAWETATSGPTYLWQAGIVGDKSIGLTNGATSGGAWASDAFPVTPNQNLVLSLLVMAVAANTTNAYVRIFYGTSQTFTRSTGLISTTPASPTNVQWMNTSTGGVNPSTGGGGTGYAEFVGGWSIPVTAPIQLSGVSSVPAGASWARVAVYNWQGTSSTVYYDEVNVNDLILSARIANGTITANNIMANTINTGQLNASAINGMTINSNTINSATINSAVINSATINSGTVTVSAALEMSTGGIIRTAAVGSARIEIGHSVGTGVANTQLYYTGDSAEGTGGVSTPQGFIGSGVSGSGTTRQGYINIWAPALNTGTRGAFTIYGPSADNTIAGKIFANGHVTLGSSGFEFQAGQGNTFQDGNVRLMNNAIFMRTVGDNNHWITYDSTVNGPTLGGFGGAGIFITSGGGNYGTAGNILAYQFDSSKFWSPADNTRALGTSTQRWTNGFFMNITNFAGSTSGTTCIFSSTNLLARSSSSKRFKTKIKSHKDLRWDILDLKPVTYHMKGDLHMGLTGDYMREVGLIAEDVHDAGFPDLIQYEVPHRKVKDETETEHGWPEYELTGEPVLPESVKYDRIAVLLLPIIKDLRDRVVALENR